MYNLFFYLLIFCNLLVIVFGYKNIRIFYYLIGILLICFCGLRLSVGFDYDNYLIMYDNVKSNYSMFIEPIFFSIIKIEQKLVGNYRFFIFLVAFLTVSIKLNYIKKYSIYPFLSLLIYYSRYFLTFDFGQIRQGLATAIVLYSIVYVVNRNFKKFLILILISSLIHASAILFVIIYFIGYKFFKIYKYVGIIIFSFIFVFIDLKDFLINTFSKVLPGGLSQKLLFYGGTEESLGLNLSMLLRVIFVLYILIFLTKYLKKNKLFLTLFNTYFIGVIIYLVFNSLPQLGGRGSAYFQQFEILLLPIMVYYTKDYLIRFFIIIFLFYYSYSSIQSILESALSTNEYYFEPYKSIFL